MANDIGRLLKNPDQIISIDCCFNLANERKRDELMNNTVAEKIFNHILFIESKIDAIIKEKNNKLDIHDMADLERYSNALKNLSLTLLNLEKTDYSQLPAKGGV